MEIEVVRHPFQRKIRWRLQKGTPEKESNRSQTANVRKTEQARVRDQKRVWVSIKGQGQPVKRRQTIQVIRIKMPQRMVRQRQESLPHHKTPHTNNEKLNEWIHLYLDRIWFVFINLPNKIYCIESMLILFYLLQIVQRHKL
jgi:hypothetical protein